MTFYPKTGNNQSYDPSKDLNTIANELETDKGTADKLTLSWGHLCPTNFCWGYTQTYNTYMKTFREKKVKLLEIGICDGRFKYASPKMWLKYFKDIDLYCVDNFWGTGPELEATNIDDLNKMGVNFIYADQGSEEDWNKIDTLIEYESLDFLIEDGSHYTHHMVYSLWRGAKLLKKGGYYFMEDIQNPETCRGFWGYDNADLSTDLKNFLSNGVFSNPHLSEEACKYIVNHFEIVDLILDNTNMNYLAVFCKK